MLQDLDVPDVGKIQQLEAIEERKCVVCDLSLFRSQGLIKRHAKMTRCPIVVTIPSPFLERTNFDEEFGTSNGDYTLGEMFWTATNMFGGRYDIQFRPHACNGNMR